MLFDEQEGCHETPLSLGSLMPALGTSLILDRSIPSGTVRRSAGAIMMRCPTLLEAFFCPRKYPHRHPSHARRILLERRIRSEAFDDILEAAAAQQVGAPHVARAFGLRISHAVQVVVIDVEALLGGRARAAAEDRMQQAAVGVGLLAWR